VLKVLIVTHYFWPESFRINEVAESLRRAGCEVTILTGQPNYPEGKTFTGYRWWGMGRGEDDRGNEIFRVPLVPRGKSSALRMCANYFSFMFAGMILAPWLLRGRRFDVVFVYGNSPLVQALPGIVMGAVKRAPVVLWVQDLWPQSLEVTGYVRSPALLRAVARLVRWIYRHCDLLLAQSKAFVITVGEMAGGTPVEYHPNPGELAFGEAVRTPVALTLEPGFNVVFAGNLGKVQALDTILAAAQLLRDDTEVRFVLVGSGNLGDWIKQEIARLGLANVVLAGRFPQEQMPGILAQASALLVTLARNPILEQTVPSKVQAYLAAGRPIIASLDGEGARIVEEADCGISCPAEDAARLAQAVTRLRSCSGERLRELGENGRSYYSRNFDPAALAARLVRRFESLAGSRQATGK
jgi:glycosyltransferase involved in cell wall biosynthesis